MPQARRYGTAQHSTALDVALEEGPFPAPESYSSTPKRGSAFDSDCRSSFSFRASTARYWDDEWQEVFRVRSSSRDRDMVLGSISCG